MLIAVIMVLPIISIDYIDKAFINNRFRYYIGVLIDKYVY